MKYDNPKNLPKTQTSYDIVIVTCNRPQALAMSLPLVKIQTRPPHSIIIVDASDDHQTVKETIDEALLGWSGSLIVEKSEKGIARQRNIGARIANSEVVVYVDDDSLPYKDSFSEMMRIYDYDTDRKIVGVCAADAPLPPLEAVSKQYNNSWEHKVSRLNLQWPEKLKQRLIKIDQFRILGEQNMRKWDSIDWLQKFNAIPVPWMTGFRMSFRRIELLQTGFDENLSSYSLFEDMDMCLRIGRIGALVGAKSAKIHHYKFPGPREDSYSYGKKQVINRAYIVAKNSPPGDGSESAYLTMTSLYFYLYIAKKIMHRLPFLWSRWFRKETIGMISALPRAIKIIRATKPQLEEIYRESIEAI